MWVVTQNISFCVGDIKFPLRFSISPEIVCTFMRFHLLEGKCCATTYVNHVHILHARTCTVMRGNCEILGVEGTVEFRCIAGRPRGLHAIGSAVAERVAKASR